MNFTSDLSRQIVTRRQNTESSIALGRMLNQSALAVALLLILAPAIMAQVYGVSRRTTVVHRPNSTVVRQTTVVHGAALPHGYIATLPGGYRPIYVGGARYYTVGGIYYRPQIYSGRTVYVRVHI